jgi:hypothetical protein
MDEVAQADFRTDAEQEECGGVENGYELIVIPYWENVEEVLTRRLLKKAA